MIDRLELKIKLFKHFELRNLHLYSNTRKIYKLGERTGTRNEIQAVVI